MVQANQDPGSSEGRSSGSTLHTASRDGPAALNTQHVYCALHMPCMHSPPYCVKGLSVDARLQDRQQCSAAHRCLHLRTQHSGLITKQRLLNIFLLPFLNMQHVHIFFGMYCVKSVHFLIAIMLLMRFQSGLEQNFQYSTLGIVVNGMLSIDNCK